MKHEYQSAIYRGQSIVKQRGCRYEPCESRRRYIGRMMPVAVRRGREAVLVATTEHSCKRRANVATARSRAHGECIQIPLLQNA